jgi:hypothetical protein
MSHSDIAIGRESEVTNQTKKNTRDDASVETTIINNLSHRENINMTGLSVITGFSFTKKRTEEIDKQRDEFMTKKIIMDDSISSVTSSVSKLIIDMLALIIGMKKMSDKFEQIFN